MQVDRNRLIGAICDPSLFIDGHSRDVEATDGNSISVDGTTGPWNMEGKSGCAWMEDTVSDFVAGLRNCSSPISGLQVPNERDRGRHGGRGGRKEPGDGRSRGSAETSSYSSDANPRSSPSKTPQRTSQVCAY